MWRPASLLINGNGSSFQGGKSGRVIKLMNHFYLLSRLRESGAVHVLHGVEGKFNFLPGFVPQNTLTGFYDFLQLLKANSGEKREVYLRVEPRQLVSPSIPAH